MTGEPARSADSPLAALRGVFVVGLARSGTSLLRALLDGHPELWVPPGESLAVDWCGAPDPAEAYLRSDRDVKFAPRGSADFERFMDALRAALDGPTDPARGVLAWLSAAAAILPPAPGARAWVEKTPKHLRRVPFFLERFGPRTRVLCVLRDPRAVFASFRARWGWSGTTSEDVRRMARRWALADALADELAARHPEVRVLRYEDLVCEPRATMQLVARHLEIAWDEILCVPTRAGVPWTGNSSFDAAHDGISRASLRRWTEVFPPSILADLEARLAPRMVRRGYRLEHAPRRPGAWWRGGLDVLRRAGLAWGTSQRLTALRRNAAGTSGDKAAEAD